MTEIRLKTPVSKEEYNKYKQYFKALDVDRTKVVTAEVAKPFMEQSGLSGRQLGTIWALVDLDGKGFLIFKEFCAMVRIISHVLETPNVPLTSTLYDSPAAHIFDAVVPERKRKSRVKSTPLPLLTSNDISRFSQLFDRTTGETQLLPGDKARDIFVKANLPTEVLGDIWFLCDREQDGCLDKFEFIMAMHLIGLRIAQNPLMDPVPKKISRKLWESAGLKLPSSSSNNSSRPSSVATTDSYPNSTFALSRTSSHRSSRSVPSSRRSSRQFSPSSQQISANSQRTQSPMITRTLSGSSIHSPNSNNNSLTSLTPMDNNNENPWNIQLDQFKYFQNSFITLDKDQIKELGPHTLVPFFMKSGLTRETLANVWDLADLNKTGTLNQMEFIIAMFLIQRVKTTRAALPFKVPQDLLDSITKIATKVQRSSSIVASPVANDKVATGLGISSEITKEEPVKETIPKDVTENIAAKKEHIANLNKQIDEANEKLAQVQVTEKDYEKELHELEDIEESLIIKLNGINNSIKQSSTKSEKLQQSISNVKKNSEQLKQQMTIAEGNYHAIDARVSNLDDDLKETVEKNEQLKKEIADMQSMTASLQPKFQAKQEELKQFMDFVNESTRTLEAEKITVEYLQKEIDGLDKLSQVYKEKVETMNLQDHDIDNQNITN